MNKRENIVGSIIRMLYTVLLPLSSQVWYKYYVMLHVWGFIWLPWDIYFYTVYILCAIFCYIHNQEAPYRITFWLAVSEESQWGWRWSHDGHLVNITKYFFEGSCNHQFILFIIGWNIMSFCPHQENEQHLEKILIIASLNLTKKHRLCEKGI